MSRALRLLVLALAALLLVRPDVLRAEESGPVIRFLDAKEAAAAIVDESMEPYFSLLQPREMTAKLGGPLEAKELPAQRDECRRRYSAAALEFDADEKAVLGETVRRIHEALKGAQPRFTEAPWSFLKLDDSVEGGLPHTRGPHVVLPSRAAKRVGKLRGLAPGGALASIPPASLAHTVTLLLHEQCHVLQRARPALFEDLYVKVWGFVRAKGVTSAPWLETVQIVNPDGVDVGWAYPVKEGGATVLWQPLVVLNETADPPRMPQDFATIAVRLDRKGAVFSPHLSKEGKPETRPLDGIESYREAFGRTGEDFHPNEIFAVLYSWLAMGDHVDPVSLPLTAHAGVDFTKLRAWCKARLGPSAK